METDPYPDPAISPGEVADQSHYSFILPDCKPMEITISQREQRYESKQPCFTLTVSAGEQRLAVNITRHEAYRIIDAHGLTPYDERNFDSLTEYRWDNTPPTTSEEKQQTI